MLASCYRNSLSLAVEKVIKTIAFPSISTGAYRFPVKRAARIAILEITKFLEKDRSLDKVFVVCYDEATFEVYETVSKEFKEPEI